jgi:hypothetical protein
MSLPNISMFAASKHPVERIDVPNIGTPTNSIDGFSYEPCSALFRYLRNSCVPSVSSPLANDSRNTCFGSEPFSWKRLAKPLSKGGWV